MKLTNTPSNLTLIENTPEVDNENANWSFINVIRQKHKSKS